MDRWIYWGELLELQDWTVIELLNHIKAGLPAYDKIGRRIVDLDTLPLRKRPREEIDEMIRGKWVFYRPSLDDLPSARTWEDDLQEFSDPSATQKEETVSNISSAAAHQSSGHGTTTSERHGIVTSDEELISKKVEELYEGLPGIPVIPPGCEPISFTMLLSNAEVPEFLDRFKSFRFKYQDVIDFEQNNALFVEGEKDYPFPKTLGATAASTFASLPLRTEGIKPMKQTPIQQDKQTARQIAEEYIRDCKDGLPSIKEAINLVKDKYTKALYTDKTIRNWIKELFPPESRKPGRKPKETSRT